VLKGFEEKSEDQHRQGCTGYLPRVAEAEGREEGYGQVGAEMQDLVADMQATEGYYCGRFGGQ
jgi:hypothetical protein